MASVLAIPARAACLDQGRPCCDYCRMLIERREFGGEIRTTDRQRLTFDATECMAAFWVEARGDTARVRSMTSIRFDRPKKRVDARAAWYLMSDSLQSPMAVGLSAYRSAAAAQAARQRHGGQVMRWNQVVAFVRDQWGLESKK